MGYHAISYFNSYFLDDYFNLFYRIYLLLTKKEGKFCSMEAEDVKSKLQSKLLSTETTRPIIVNRIL